MLLDVVAHPESSATAALSPKIQHGSPLLAVFIKRSAWLVKRAGDPGFVAAQRSGAIRVKAQDTMSSGRGGGQAGTGTSAQHRLHECSPARRCVTEFRSIMFVPDLRVVVA